MIILKRIRKRVSNTLFSTSVICIEISAGRILGTSSKKAPRERDKDSTSCGEKNFPFENFPKLSFYLNLLKLSLKISKCHIETDIDVN